MAAKSYCCAPKACAPRRVPPLPPCYATAPRCRLTCLDSGRGGASTHFAVNKNSDLSKITKNQKPKPT